MKPLMVTSTGIATTSGMARANWMMPGDGSTHGMIIRLTVRSRTRVRVRTRVSILSVPVQQRRIAFILACYQSMAVWHVTRHHYSVCYRGIEYLFGVPLLHRCSTYCNFAMACYCNTRNLQTQWTRAELLLLFRDWKYIKGVFWSSWSRYCHCGTGSLVYNMTWYYRNGTCLPLAIGHGMPVESIILQ